MESHLSVQLSARWSPGESDSTTDRQFDGWTARIGDAEFPIRDFELGADEAGQPMVSLVLAADSVQVGAPPATVAVPQVRLAAPTVARWGGGTHPDPREGIPGWAPEKLGEQVAVRAEQAHSAEAHA